MSEFMHQYYAQRAENYETIYQTPEHQADLDKITQKLQQLLSDKNVLEVGCGTAYWTERFADEANSVLATDINPAMLTLAQKKSFPLENVSFAQADVFALPKNTETKFTACFGGFLWSHIKREDYTKALRELSEAIESGGLLVLIDNNYIESNSTTIARTDLEGNTFQLRQQQDGTRVEILKNFPTDSFLRKRFATIARDIRVVRTEYFWMLTGVLK